MRDRLILRYNGTKVREEVERMNAKIAMVVAILLVLVGAGSFYFGQKYKIVPQTADTAVVQEVVAPTAATEDAAPLAEDTSAQNPSPTVDEQAALLVAVKAGLVAKHGPDANALKITVSKIVGTTAQGGASAEGGGGMWLAAKANDKWTLVWDGNGTISCAAIDSYNFPVSLVPECWNDTTGKIVKR